VASVFSETPPSHHDIPQRLSSAEINSCPLIKWDGPVRVIHTVEELNEAEPLLAAEKVLGFDTETRPAFKRGESYPPSLLQLAGAQEVFLFQLRQLGLPAPLRRILADPGIIKAGAAPAHDLNELQKLASFLPAGFVDLSVLARKAGLKNHGLRGLAAVLLGRRISKSARTSNWAQSTLTPRQIVYAATDAWLSRILYLELQRIQRPAFPATGSP
jgi:ribonuclease D